MRNTNKHRVVQHTEIPMDLFLPEMQSLPLLACLIENRGESGP